MGNYSSTSERAVTISGQIVISDARLRTVDLAGSDGVTVTTLILNVPPVTLPPKDGNDRDITTVENVPFVAAGCTSMFGTFRLVYWTYSGGAETVYVEDSLRIDELTWTSKVGTSRSSSYILLGHGHLQADITSSCRSILGGRRFTSTYKEREGYDTTPTVVSIGGRLTVSPVTLPVGGDQYDTIELITEETGTDPTSEVPPPYSDVAPVKGSKSHSIVHIGGGYRLLTCRARMVSSSGPYLPGVDGTLSLSLNPCRNVAPGKRTPSIIYRMSLMSSICVFTPDQVGSVVPGPVDLGRVNLDSLSTRWVLPYH